MKHAYVFPGQGAQAVGMGKDLYDNVPEAKELFEKANEILGFRITDIMFAGTDEQLKQTKVTQPAVFLHSVIMAKALGVPVRADILVKRVSLSPQAMLDREERRKLPQPFEAVGRLDGLHVLLIDDVCTTKATLQRAADCLLRAGASRVDAAVVARSSRHGTGREPALP